MLTLLVIKLNINLKSHQNDLNDFLVHCLERNRVSWSRSHRVVPGSSRGQPAR